MVQRSSLLVLTLAACADVRGEPAPGVPVDEDISFGSTGEPTHQDDARGDTGERFDVGVGTGEAMPCGGQGEGAGECECEIEAHAPCDGDDSDPLHAMGLGCPGTPTIAGELTASPHAVAIRRGLGNTPTWDATEGEAFLVLSTGIAAELDTASSEDESEWCTSDLGSAWDVGTLPAPLRPEAVTGDCLADPTLVGQGDCSGTLANQWAAGTTDGGGGTCSINGQPCCEVQGTPCPEDLQGPAQDYAELRFTTTVPDGATSLRYDLAFFTVEWPEYYGTAFNDLYVGWLESEQWTGNISFDAQGNPISLNAAFFDYLDGDGNLPQLAGTCMAGHGATKWLTTSAAVSPGEAVTMVFAVMDLSDSILDSVVFLDNWRWGCDGVGQPQTVPVG